ncbi:MAG TPA: glycosyltransferase family 2 protein [Nitrospiraceae bacterium]|nr:glycosyltransferase family 2 protein [Nitrospiraceae bacterium]
MIPVSVAIITKNEELNIEDALKSVSGFDDIVVVDSFSTDRTVEICRQYNCRVYPHEWQGYAKQKQAAVDYAENKWVFILDADERITPELEKEITEKITLTSSFSGFFVPRKNFFLGKWIRHSGWWPDYSVRLFKKDAARLQDRAVHEKVLVDGAAGYLKCPMEHYTYRTISDYLKKMENYSTLAAEEILLKNPLMSPISLIAKTALSPIFTFLKMFFIKQGFRDGIHGFMLAVLYSFYAFLKYAKAWEKKA